MNTTQMHWRKNVRILYLFDVKSYKYAGHLSTHCLLNLPHEET